MTQTVSRGFATIDFGQIHYRTAGPETPANDVPVLLLHPSPGSSRQMVPLIESLAASRRVIAPDTAGFGDSAALPSQPGPPVIRDFANALLAFCDAMGLDRFDVYGSHTGACIAVELANIAPGRVAHVVLDGLGIFTPEQRAELLEHYAHPFTPDHDGTQFIRAFMFCRDQYLFFPYYARSRAARRDAGLRPAGELHAWVVEVLKAAETYHLGYRAAFAWDAAAHMPSLAAPTLLMAASNDPLIEGTQSTLDMLSDGRFIALPRLDDADFGQVRTKVIVDFLDV